MIEWLSLLQSTMVITQGTKSPPPTGKLKPLLRIGILIWGRAFSILEEIKMIGETPRKMPTKEMKRICCTNLEWSSLSPPAQKKNLFHWWSQQALLTIKLMTMVSWSQISRIQRSRSSSLSCSIDQTIDQRPAVDFPGETGSINPQADLIDLLLSHLNLAAADESDQSSDEISANSFLEWRFQLLSVRLVFIEPHRLLPPEDCPRLFVCFFDVIVKSEPIPPSLQPHPTTASAAVTIPDPAEYKVLANSHSSSCPHERQSPARWYMLDDTTSH